MQQDRLIGAAGEGRYTTHRAWAGRPEYGNALLVREPLTASGVDRLELEHNRSRSGPSSGCRTARTS
jgi:hypothetical protein